MSWYPYEVYSRWVVTTWRTFGFIINTVWTARVRHLLGSVSTAQSGITARRLSGSGVATIPCRFHNVRYNPVHSPRVYSPFVPIVPRRKHFTTTIVSFLPPNFYLISTYFNLFVPESTCNWNVWYWLRNNITRNVVHDQ